MNRVHNPRQEAQSLLSDGHEARVLEPSPPAVNDGEYFADDPAVPGPVSAGSLIVTPTTAGDLTWDEMVTRSPSLAEFTTEHWLGRWKRIPHLPTGYVQTVAALNQIAFFAMAPARHAANGKLGLRYTYRGFGTPFYGNDVQFRIEDDQLVRQEADEVRGSPITTIRAATQLAGVPYLEVWGPKWHDPPKPMDPDASLDIDREAAIASSDIIGFAFSVLEQLRFDSLTRDPSRVQLWPEHFDVAVEVGRADKGQRAAFGVSPGYAAHPEPFIYVSPWEKSTLTDPYWNATTFGGSILEYEELIEADDQRESALAFFNRGMELLSVR